MFPLLLAATILGSIPRAVERTLAQLPEDEPAAVLARLKELEARTARNEKIRDDTISCISESLMGTGADLGTTGLARERCKTCGEANPLGTSADTRNALKFFQTGIEVGGCLLAAKHENSDPNKGHRHGKWIMRALRWGIVANNLYAVLAGKPLVRWGIGNREALEK